eukprot:scaffold1.g5727.t1
MAPRLLAALALTLALCGAADAATLAGSPLRLGAAAAAAQQQPGGGSYLTVQRVRLAGGASPASGRLELLIGGQWFTACSAAFSFSEAEVACRMLGLSGGFDYVYGAGPSGARASRLPITSLELQCDGSEASLASCALGAGDARGACAHDLDVGVSCGPAPSGAFSSPHPDGGEEAPLELGGAEQPGALAEPTR